MYSSSDNSNPSQDPNPNWNPYWLFSTIVTRTKRLTKISFFPHKMTGSFSLDWNWSRISVDLIRLESDSQLIGNEQMSSSNLQNSIFAATVLFMFRKVMHWKLTTKQFQHCHKRTHSRDYWFCWISRKCSIMSPGCITKGRLRYKHSLLLILLWCVRCAKFDYQWTALLLILR